MFIIVERYNSGLRDCIYKEVVSAESVYGGERLPFFLSKEDAQKYILSRHDSSYRDFEIIKMNPV